jgi:hypothetical protein
MRDVKINLDNKNNFNLSLLKNQFLINKETRDILLAEFVNLCHQDELFSSHST